MTEADIFDTLRQGLWIAVVISAPLLAVALIAAGSLTACASVTRGTKQKFYVLSEPSEAKVVLTTGQKCTTPCNFKLKRKTEFKATVTKAGYKPLTVDIESSTRGGGVAGVAGNILAGGIIGIFVDGSNGSMLDLRPNPLKVVLAVEGSNADSQVVKADKPKGMKLSADESVMPTATDAAKPADAPVTTADKTAEVAPATVEKPADSVAAPDVEPASQPME